MLRIAVVLLTSCSALDAVSIEDPDGCCSQLLEDRIRDCLVQHTEPGHCKVAECVAVTAFVCRQLDGGLWIPDGGPQ